MREKIKLNQDWRFLRGDNYSANLVSFNDRVWEHVNLPHSVDDLTVHNTSGGINFQGVCRYRKRFSIEKAAQPEKLLLEFEGAMQVLEVWINDTQLETHYCGYTPALYDITPYVSYEEENIIAVRLDNSDFPFAPPGRPQGQLDFTYEGGLYKSVYLHRMPQVHVTNAVEENIVAGGGIFVHYENITKESATVAVKTHLKNITEQAVSVQLKQSVLEEDGAIVASETMTVDLVEMSAEHFNMALTVQNPKLWHPHCPNVYILRTEVMQGDTVVDSVDTTIGIRDFNMTYEDGFVINGEKLPLSGGNYHTTFGCIGNAMSDNLLRRDMRKMREAGMISLRSHYPFPAATLEECNRLGIAVVVSNPGWQFFSEGIFAERACQNLRDIIRALRNHPCIVLWECILNEAWQMPDEFELTLKDIAHAELPVGPCYTASDTGLSDVAYKWDDKRSFGPVMLAKNPEKYEATARNSKGKPRWQREYGDGPDNFIDQNTVWRTPRAWGEDMMVKQVRRMIWTKQEHWLHNYIGNYNDPHISGYGMWPAIEHNRGYHMNPCYGGFLDLLRIPKYSFYFFKSQQDADIHIKNVDSGAMVFIANSWSELAPDDITVYSNCERVRLYHNDVLVEERTPDNVAVKHPPFTFKNEFYYDRGRTEIRVEGLIGGEVVATDRRHSPGVTSSLVFEPDTMDIDMVADGSDLMFVRIKAVDDNGFVVPLSCDSHELVVSISGEGKLIGSNVVKTELGITGVLVQSTTVPGTIKLHVEFKYPQVNLRAQIKDGDIEITTHPEKK